LLPLPPSPPPVSIASSPPPTAEQQPPQQLQPLEQIPPQVVPNEMYTIKGKTLNILLAEDDIILRQIFDAFWKRQKNANISVFMAEDGLKAVQFFKQQRFSIIFIDIDMPYMNGLEATKEMRKFEKENDLHRTPIIGVSGYTTRQYKEKAVESGMDDFLSKGNGYQMKDVYGIVVQYCGERVQ
jgi:CheY-like chemotaxis protein